MIDINKKYQTRGGQDVRIYATDGNANCPVHGAIKTRSNTWAHHAWLLNGQWLGSNIPHDNDLVEISQRYKQVAWLNIKQDHSIDAFSKEYYAREARDQNTIAHIAVYLDYQEGEGL